jgi:hypothetical protein
MHNKGRAHVLERDKAMYEKIAVAKKGKPLSETHKAALKAAWALRKLRNTQNLRQFAFQA